MWDLRAALTAVSGTVWAKGLFTGPRDSEGIRECRVFLEVVHWELSIDFVPYDYVGYYVVNQEKRTVAGLWPTTPGETVFYLLNASLLVFDAPVLSKASDWIRDIVRFSTYIDHELWRKQVGAIEKELSALLHVGDVP